MSWMFILRFSWHAMAMPEMPAPTMTTSWNSGVSCGCSQGGSVSSILVILLMEDVDGKEGAIERRRAGNARYRRAQSGVSTVACCCPDARACRRLTKGVHIARRR